MFIPMHFLLGEAMMNETSFYFFSQHVCCRYVEKILFCFCMLICVLSFVKCLSGLSKLVEFLEYFKIKGHIV